MSEQIRVVLADDHGVVRLGLRALLETTDDIAVVGEAHNGDEAVRLAVLLRPDVVLMDLSMDTLDGLEATRRLVHREKPPRVLVLTMHEEDDFLIPALEAGASGYIVKAAAATELLDAIRAVAAGQTWVRPVAAPVLAAGWSRRAGKQELASRFETLSDREREVFRLIAQGHATGRIGEILHVSPKTVDTYRRRVNDKLGIAERSDYVRIALALGLLSSA